MSSRRLRRSSYPRRRRPRGFLWTLLSLLTLGALATILASRRPVFPEDAEPEPARGGGSDPEPPEPVPGESLWIAGPAGNLYVRDGGEDADALPVLFLHSLAGNGGQWSLQLDHLRRHRRAVALDFRGHGESDPAEDGDYSVPGFAADVAAAADQLGLRRFLLAGHSLGAAAAIEYASRHPERVAGLLLVDPGGDQSRVPAREVEQYLESLRSDPLAELESYFRQMVIGGDPDASRWVLEDLHVTHEDAVLGALADAARYEPLPALERYPGPRLSIISDMNRLPYSLHNLLPDLPVRLMTGTGHWLMMDRPEVFNHLLDEFVSQVETVGGSYSRSAT
ncbi:MAG TPA: alpha/beta fold hydrolase [Thermoanaerobaculia bacterium]|jgi:pimeloyl-ACP methyl ester carboxylesterase|nr:alpha/beta fold hydrolase [Thermoanaerobaculia bacterium]